MSTDVPPDSADSLSAFWSSQKEPRWLKKASIAAIVIHFGLFSAVFPGAQPRYFPGSRAEAVVIQIYKPPSPPPPEKPGARKWRARRVPIPDPTPNETETLEWGEYTEFESLEAEFRIDLPEGPVFSRRVTEGVFDWDTPGLISPELIHSVRPAYTSKGVRESIQGEVLIQALITAEGNVSEPRLLEGLLDEELNRRAVEAVLEWRFQPGRKDGQPVAVIAILSIDFRNLLTVSVIIPTYNRSASAAACGRLGPGPKPAAGRAHRRRRRLY